MHDQGIQVGAIAVLSGMKREKCVLTYFYMKDNLCEEHMGLVLQ
jgi:hypothetical protein